MGLKKRIAELIEKSLGLTLKGVVRAYQLFISPILPGACRYYPSCSHYALDAINHKGPAKGAWLAVKRIARCHPWGGEGFDPVPGSSLDRPQTSSEASTRSECRHAH